MYVGGMCMIGEDVSAFSDRGILHMANFEGPTRTHQSSNSLSSALHFGPWRVSLQDHPVDYVFIFLGPRGGWHSWVAYRHPAILQQKWVYRTRFQSYRFLHYILRQLFLWFVTRLPSQEDQEPHLKHIFIPWTNIYQGPTVPLALF